MEVKRIVPSSVEMFPTAKPTEVNVTSPVMVSIAPVIMLLAVFVRETLPFPFVIFPDIDAKPELLVRVISPVSLEIFPETENAPELFVPTVR